MTKHDFQQPADIAWRRVAAQLPPRPLPNGPADVVRALGAVQAQDYHSAKWAIGLRLRASTDAMVEDAVSSGAILRTHILRPTWHFVVPADIRWMLALTAPRIHLASAHMYRRTELDAKVFRRSEAVLRRELANGKYRTRTELGAALQRAGIVTTDLQRLGYLMMRAELDAVIVSGPRRGAQFTYALLDERVPVGLDLRPDEPLLELARRFFAHRGPATANDFAWWSGLTVTEARRGIAMAGKELDTADVDGRRYFVADRPARRRGAPRAHLLPNFDEAFIGFKDRSAFGIRAGSLSPAVRAKTFRAHVIELDGQLVGGWRRTLAGKTVEVELDVVVRLSKGERQAIDRAVADYRAFVLGRRK